MLGDGYTVVDMAVWGWSRLIPVVLGQDAPKQYPNLQRHLAEISARPAAVKALALKDKHAFKTEMDDTARNAMFPHLAKKVA
jgi:GST-like protein